MPSGDALGRTPISDAVKQQIDLAFMMVPEEKRGALLVIADEQGARAHVAAKLGTGWKVAGGLGASWRGKVHGTVAVVGVWCLCLFLLASPALAHTPDCQKEYQATVVRVIDGDTYELRLDLGWDVTVKVPIRLRGLDTPEMREPRGPAAKAEAERILRSGPITVRPLGRMTFSRHVADIYIDGKSLADLLRERGHEK